MNSKVIFCWLLLGSGLLAFNNDILSRYNPQVTMLLNRVNNLEREVNSLQSDVSRLESILSNLLGG